MYRFSQQARSIVAHTAGSNYVIKHILLKAMNYKGINYDIGTKTLKGGLTREMFDLDIVAREIAIIKNELHCNAIRISGVDIERISNAAEIALKVGLTVLFSPSLHYESQEKTLQYFFQAAEAAEKLRAQYSSLIFVAGCELSFFTEGFVKGETGTERMNNIFSPLSLLKNMLGLTRTYNKLLNKFLKFEIDELRKRFKGKITYASGTWEKVNWDLFDIVGIDHYRSSFNKTTYVTELRKYQQIGKPLIIMEFGCCAYKGADDKGAIGWAIVNWQKDKPELKGEYTRDESVQANYLADLLSIFEAEKVAGTFVFNFGFANYLHSDIPKYDLDMASYGVVKMLPADKQPGYKGLQWQPKEAFSRVAAWYKNN